MSWFLTLSTLALGGESADDPFGVAAYLAASGPHEGWVCVSACLDGRCGWECDGPGAWSPYSSEAWRELLMKDGCRSHLIVKVEDEWRRKANSGGWTRTDPLRQLITARLTAARAALDAPAPEWGGWSECSSLRRREGGSR